MLTIASRPPAYGNPPRPRNRLDLHKDLRNSRSEYKSTSANKYVTYKHPDGRIGTIKPTEEVIPTKPVVSTDGKKYNARMNYEFERLPDGAHSTGHFVEPLP